MNTVRNNEGRLVERIDEIKRFTKKINAEKFCKKYNDNSEDWFLKAVLVEDSKEKQQVVGDYKY